MTEPIYHFDMISRAFFLLLVFCTSNSLAESGSQQGQCRVRRVKFDFPGIEGCKNNQVTKGVAQRSVKDACEGKLGSEKGTYENHYEMLHNLNAKDLQGSSKTIAAVNDAKTEYAKASKEYCDVSYRCFAQHCGRDADMEKKQQEQMDKWGKEVSEGEQFAAANGDFGKSVTDPEKMAAQAERLQQWMNANGQGVCSSQACKAFNTYRPFVTGNSKAAKRFMTIEPWLGNDTLPGFLPNDPNRDDGFTGGVTPYYPYVPSAPTAGMNSNGTGSHVMKSQGRTVSGTVTDGNYIYEKPIGPEEAIENIYGVENDAVDSVQNEEGTDTPDWLN